MTPVVEAETILREWNASRRRNGLSDARRALARARGCRRSGHFGSAARWLAEAGRQRRELAHYPADLGLEES